MNKKRTINNIIQNKNSFKKISIYSRKKFINDVMTKIKKLSLLILLIIILNIKATRIFSPHLKYLKNIKDVKVGLCAIGKKENLYVQEYVKHYKNIGYNHIFLYDNNDIGDEKLEDVLYNEVNSGFVTIINKRGIKNQQGISYKDCYEKNKKEYDWLSFFDMDEFLFIKHNKTVQEFLSDEKYKKCMTVKVNWLFYTDNDLVYYENKPLNERFTTYRLDYFPNIHIKSTVRGNLSRNYWSSLNNPHTSTVRYLTCNTLGQKIKFDTPFNPPNYDFAYIKHFSTKTIEQFCNKVRRGYVSRDFQLNKKNWAKRFNNFFLLNKKTKEKLDYIKSKFQIDLS